MGFSYRRPTATGAGRNAGRPQSVDGLYREEGLGDKDSATTASPPGAIVLETDPLIVQGVILASPSIALVR